MTKEEIVRNLKYVMKKHKDDRVNTFDINIYLMCKDILGYLEQEPSGDAISRQATIEAFQMFRGYEANRTNAEWVDRIETIVKKLPSVTTEPETEPKYCDRNICVSNEYNGIGCEDCEVTKSQEPSSSENPNKWIPIRERLPEESSLVLISCEDYYLRDLNPCIGWRNGKYWNTFTAYGCKQILYPIAWMPLPEPYKAESESI